MRAGLIDRAPAPALAAGANALGLYYRLNRYTPRMRALISQWQTLERMPLAQIRTRQLDRLRHILRAAARTPFYAERFRAAGLAPATSPHWMTSTPCLFSPDRTSAITPPT